jgi:hypothetical protein
MPAYTTVRSALLITMILLICEMADVAVMVAILGKAKFELMMTDSVQKALIGFPGAVFFSLLVTIAYFIMNRQQSLRKLKKENG